MIRKLDEEIPDDDNPILRRYRSVLYPFNEVASQFSVEIDGYDYPMTLRAPMHSPTGKLVKGRLKWGVRLYAEPASSLSIPDTNRPAYQFFGEEVRLDANRYVHPRGELVEIDIKASHLGIIKHLFCGDKTPWNGDPYRNAIRGSFPWLNPEEVNLIRKEMKYLCGILGVTTTGKRGACTTYTKTIRRKEAQDGVPKESFMQEQELRDFLRITSKKKSLATVLWETFFRTMPKKMQTYMDRHKKSLHIAVQGIEGQVMLDVINGIGVHALPLVMHDGILVPKSFEAVTKDILRHAYRDHTKGGEVVLTVSHQNINSATDAESSKLK